MADFSMRRMLSSGIFLLVLFVAAKAVADAPPGYYLVWSDEFNGPALDRAKWDYWLLGPRRNAINVTNAISLNGSNLVITTYTSNKVHYTGVIGTDQTFRPRFGYWESSIRWGDTNGMWSAFWLQSPEMVTRSPDPKLSGSEIDIAEHRFLDKDASNIANKIQVNLHWNGYGPSSHSSGSGNVANNLATGFHTYGFLWTPDAYSFFVDDAKVHVRGSAPISHSTAWVAFSSEVDDTSTLWAGHIPRDGYGSLEDSTTTLAVDYVRYYAPSNVLFWTGAESVYWTNSGNWIARRLPTPDSDLTFSSLTANSKTMLARDYSINSLVLLQTKEDILIEGTNALNVGAGGIDMSAANRALTITAPINITAPQTWLVGQKAGALSVTEAGLSGKEALTKAGAGALILNVSNDFSGSFNLADGVLVVNGSLAANPLMIHGTLRGSGFISGPAIVESNGVISPGDPIGTLTVAGLTLSSNSVTALEINSSLGTSDRLRVAGSIIYRGNLVVTNLSGELRAGDRFKVFDGQSYHGTFEHVQLPPLSPELVWNPQALTNGILSVEIRKQP
jgi:autotransporter-associated beta strand protein